MASSARLNGMIAPGWQKLPFLAVIPDVNPNHMQYTPYADNTGYDPCHPLCQDCATTTCQKVTGATTQGGIFRLGPQAI